MIPKAELCIRLTPGWPRPRVGEIRLNAIFGGPETLLSWLENQLGLRAAPIDHTARITEYITTLEECENASFAQSLASDRWATGARLLELRDELRLAGWSEGEHAALPDIVKDLARAAKGKTFTRIGPSERLVRVLQALADGQTLPPHTCKLADPVDAWPLAWRKVFEKLSIEVQQDSRESAAMESSLRVAQDIVHGKSDGPLVADETFRYVSTRSEATACEYIAQVLNAEQGSLTETVIYCEDDALAMRLDTCLSRYGLPTMGVSRVSRAHPVMQVLPLFVGLLWDPVDPQVLLDFLTLPVSPIQKRAAYLLAKSLAKQPGLGSTAWEEAIEALCCPSSDPEGKLKTQLSEWLAAERVARGTAASTALIRDRCKLVAQWAASRALKMRESADPCKDLVIALQAAANHAALLGELVQVQGSAIREPQLLRLLEETLGRGLGTCAAIEDSRGSIRVRSLSEIVSPVKRLIWLGLGTADAELSRWSKSDREALAQAGVELDDGSKAVSALRRAEAKGFCCVQGELLAVLIPADTTRRWHPLWLAVRNVLGEANEPIRLEDAICDGRFDELAPFVPNVSTREVILPQPRRPLWSVSVETLQERDTVSATELHTRLACPLKWTFEYLARLRPSVIVELPSDFLLKGTFCHDLLRRVFGSGDVLPTASDAERRIGEVFDERIALDAAPLAQPHLAAQRRRLRHELCNATRTLVEALSAAGFRIAAIESDVKATALGKVLTGAIDCLAERPTGEEAVIDFKYAGKKYRKLLADGRAVQLATYAHARSQAPAAGGRYPHVAYLVISEGQLFALSGSALAGGVNTQIVDGPDMQTVWTHFSNAIGNASEWMNGGGEVPARPLQASDQWPNNAEIVLDGNLGETQEQDVCRYCDYSALCGMRILS